MLFASGDEKILALKQATSGIPIVMTACDAIEIGFVSSLAHPGGNLTGVTTAKALSLTISPSVRTR